MRIRHPVVVDVSADSWRFYYEPILALFSEIVPTRAVGEGLVTVIDERLDVRVSIDATVLRLLRAGQWAEARAVAADVAPQHDELALRADGLRVAAGRTWLERFDDEGADRR